MNISRNTIQRDLVREAVKYLFHPTAEEVYDYIVKIHPTVSKATVYRNLNVLVENGEVRRFSTDEVSARYDGNVSDQHYHGKCNLCGKIIDIPPESNEKIYQQVVNIFKKEGFEVERFEVVFFGSCAQCKQKEEALL
ncbi:MAG: transcriptional repressor [Clostridiales bacterium]|nr:transcriptional repressor [Clostridiales bacterium]